MKQLSLPEKTVTAIRKRGIRRLVKQIIKCLLFWAISITAIFFTERQSKLLTWEALPIWFWGIVLLLLCFPVWKFGLFRCMVCPTFHGKLEKEKTETAFGNRNGIIKGMLFRAMGTTFIEVRIMTFRSEKGIPHRFTYSAARKVNFVRNYYRIGDEVYYPPFAEFPFNKSRAPSRPFCLCCGYIGAETEDNCPDCGVPFVKKSTSEDEQNSQSF